MGASRSQSRNDSSSCCESGCCLLADRFAARLSDLRRPSVKKAATHEQLRIARRQVRRAGATIVRREERGPAMRLDPSKRSSPAAISAGGRDEKSVDAKRTCAGALLDTPRPCDMLARGKRTGIPITCRLLRTSTHSRRSGSAPTEPTATQEPMRWATERRHFKALLHEAHRRAGGTPHQLVTSCVARPRRAWVACDLSPCFEVRGMRIAAHFRQALDRRRPGASS